MDNDDKENFCNPEYTCEINETGNIQEERKTAVKR